MVGSPPLKDVVVAPFSNWTGDDPNIQDFFSPGNIFSQKEISRAAAPAAARMQQDRR
jgi:hypothetical protein